MKRYTRSCTLLLIPAVCLVLGGCQPIIGWMVNAFAPPKQVEALYEPPAKKKILVFVDDLRNPVSYEPVKGELTDRLNDQLTAHRIAGQTVTYEDLLRLIAATPNFNELAVGEVGQRLGADIVLYVEIDEFSLRDAEDNPLWQGRLSTKVRMVDVLGGRLWPEDRPDGYPLEPVETPATSHLSASYGEQLSRDLAALMADRIAKLFHKHKVSAEEAAQRERGDF